MTQSIHPLIITVGILFVVVNTAALLIWLERRLLALWQDRYGPNRVGPFGLLQVLADMIKIFTKEDWVPPFADRPVFVLAPSSDCHCRTDVVCCHPIFTGHLGCRS